MCSWEWMRSGGKITTRNERNFRVWCSHSLSTGKLLSIAFSPVLYICIYYITTVLVFARAHARYTLLPRNVDSHCDFLACFNPRELVWWEHEDITFARQPTCRMKTFESVSKPWSNIEYMLHISLSFYFHFFLLETK